MGAGGWGGGIYADPATYLRISALLCATKCGVKSVVPEKVPAKVLTIKLKGVIFRKRAMKKVLKTVLKRAMFWIFLIKVPEEC